MTERPGRQADCETCGDDPHKCSKIPMTNCAKLLRDAGLGETSRAVKEDQNGEA